MHSVYPYKIYIKFNDYLQNLAKIAPSLKDETHI